MPVVVTQFRIENFVDFANELAQQRVPGARLSRINAKGRWVADGVNLEEPSARVIYRFGSGERCVEVEVNSTAVIERAGGNCKTVVSPPACAIKKAIASVPGLDKNPSIELDYAATPNGKGSWVVLVNGTRTELPDRC